MRNPMRPMAGLGVSIALGLGPLSGGCGTGPALKVGDSAASDGRAAAAGADPAGHSPLTPVILDGQGLSERLGACADVVVLSAHRHLCRTSGDLTLVDESLDDALSLGAAEVVAGVEWRGQTWVVRDGVPTRVDAAGTHPLELPVPVPIDGMRRAGDAIWLEGAGRLFELTVDDVREIVVEGVDTIHAHALTEQWLFLSVPELVVIKRTGTALETERVWNRPVTAMATDAEGALWLLADGALYRWAGSGDPEAVEVPEPVLGLAGPPLWLAGADHLYRQDKRTFARLPVPEADTRLVAVDPLGRLLLLDGQGLLRQALGRPVAVVGLPESLEVRTTVQLLPTDPGSLDGLSAWLGDQALPVRADPWEATLDPEDLPAGDHELRFFTTSALGDHLSSQSLWVGELPDVTWSEIDQISSEHCIACHGGDTATELVDAEQWAARIDEIIALVSTGEMPLGGPALDDEDIVRIRAWKHGGFP